MEHSKKILLNTIVVYIKIILNSILTLFSTRIVLDCLGVSDFGLYNLISGVIVLLSFLNGALMVSTQRYLSITIGENNQSKLSAYFNASITIHAVLALVIIILLVILQPILINHILNISPENIKTAHIIYDIMIISSALTLLQVPYSAAMNAHEDIYVWAFTEAVNCALRLLAAIALLYISFNKLEAYTFFILIALAISAGLKYVWCRMKYAETKLIISKMKHKAHIKEMVGFVGWNTLGSSAVLVRNQGVAILLNIFFGTIVNAAYGIANQVNGLILTLASTISTVFFPSIVQAHGAGDDERMIRIAILSSKFTFLISSLTALPLLLFMPEILQIWLKTIPEYSVTFCRLIIVVFLILQLTTGFNRVIYAVGKIKGYQISLAVILFAILPIGYIAFKCGMAVDTIFYIMIGAQILTMISNIYFARKYTVFNVIHFCKQSIVIAVALYSIIFWTTNYVVNNISLNLIGYITTTIISGIVYLCIYVFLILDKIERKQIFKLIKK